MKKIGEATFLIVADVVQRILFPIRSVFFCSRFIVYEEQSSLMRTYYLQE